MFPRAFKDTACVFVSISDCKYEVQLKLTEHYFASEKIFSNEHNGLFYWLHNLKLPPAQGCYILPVPTNDETVSSIKAVKVLQQSQNYVDSSDRSLNCIFSPIEAKQCRGETRLSTCKPAVRTPHLPFFRTHQHHRHLPAAASLHSPSTCQDSQAESFPSPGSYHRH